MQQAFSFRVDHARLTSACGQVSGVGDVGIGPKPQEAKRKIDTVGDHHYGCGEVKTTLRLCDGLREAPCTNRKLERGSNEAECLLPGHGVINSLKHLGETRI